MNFEDYKDIARLEATGVNDLLDKENIPNSVSLAYLNNAIVSFVGLLKETKGNIIPSMDMGYRVFIIELLKNIKPQHKELVLKEVLVPVHHIDIEEFMNSLSKDNNE